MSTIRHMVLASTVALTLAGCGSGTTASQGDQIVLSTYTNGTATYIETAAVAEAITKADGTSFRILTSDTGVGRLLPLTQNNADFSRAGAEYYYAFEADGEFAAEEWGPQPIRVVWAPKALTSYAVLADSGIEKAADLKGKAVPTYPGNPSATSKIDSLVAAGGLTRDDVETVEIDYGGQPDALGTGNIDVLYISVTASSMQELAGKNDFNWLELDPNDEQLLNGLDEFAPEVSVGEFSGGAGQEEGETAVGLTHAVPIVGTTESTDEEVDQLLDSVVGNYDAYRDTTETTFLWGIEEVETVPSVVPFHDALVAKLEEEGHWTTEAQEAQDELLEREKELAEGWEEVSQNSSGEELPEAWKTWKSENVDD